MLLLLLSLIGLSLQFNLDTQSVQIIKNENGLFGYTVALHKNDADEKLILVGSPSAETGVPEVLKSGAVFKCKIPRLDEVSSKPVECADFVDIFNDGGNGNYSEKGYPDILAEDKSGQFLGVSMAVNDRYVAVCGHRYEHRFWLETLVEDLPRQLIGRCLVEEVGGAAWGAELQVFKPCDNNKDSQYMTYGYCQAGMSVALRDDTLILGAPGTDQALGSAFQYDLMGVADVIPMEKIPTPQNVPTTDKYIGYSSVICNMDGDIEWNGYEMVFGGPRGEMYSGEVRIYQSIDFEVPLTSLRPYLGFDEDVKFNFVGEQMGSYFGHSLACVDVNGDGIEDLIVGAPWYTDYEGDINPDIGRIYVMLGSLDLDNVDALRNPQKITGDQANAAFGYSLANAGDMNDDNYIDVFVGAPYYNDGEGAVFLYLGSEEGLLSKYSQIIQPSKLNVLDNIRTFGWSISAGRDVDGNGYPDVAIGAYKSGHVTFIRSKSIIDVVPELKFGNSVTTFSDDVKVTTLNVCLIYSEREGRDPLDVDYVPIKIKITIDPEYKRLSFPDTALGDDFWIWVPPVMNITTRPPSPFCTSYRSIRYDNSTGNVQPLPVILSAEIDDPRLTSLVLNQELIRSKEAQLTIQSKCHNVTGICRADLNVELGEGEMYAESAKYPSIVFGYVKSFTQKITVSNIGTDEYRHVYNGAVKVSFPPEISYSAVSMDEGNVVCSMNGTFLLCKLSDDGPINADLRSQTFGIEFDISNVTKATKLKIAVEAMVGDPTIDENEANNKAEKVVEVRELADLLINGGAGRSRVAFNNKYTIVNRAIGSPDLDIKHEYSVELSEDSERPFVRGVGVKIWWPQQVPISGLYIVPLYNITLRSPEGVNVICTPSLKELYPEAVGDEESLKVTDELEVPAADVFQAVHDKPKTLNCAENTEDCQLISCEIDEIKRGSGFTNGFKISLFAKVHEANLYGSTGLNVSSVAEISHVADETDTMELPVKRSAVAKTELFPSVRKSQNWIWVIIGGIIGGLLFLFLLILALWKCGFFKRKQPPTIKADKVDEQIDMTVYGQ